MIPKTHDKLKYCWIYLDLVWIPEYHIPMFILLFDFEMIIVI